MTSDEENRAALARERDARLAAYVAAVAERDARPGDRRAEARLGSALTALNFWGDTIPAAPAAITITAPALTTSLEPGAVSLPLSEADRLANEIVVAALAATSHGVKTEADRLADEIIAAADLATTRDHD